MAELNCTETSKRLRSLPRQLLLALINATMILVIVAAVLALVAMSRIDHFAQNVAATMTEAVLSKVDLPAKDVLANLPKSNGGGPRARQFPQGRSGQENIHLFKSKSRA